MLTISKVYKNISISIEFSLIRTEQNLYRDIPYSYLLTYDLHGSIHNAFDAGKSITRASGRGFGPGNQDFFGPCEMIEPSGECHLGPKKSRFPGPN
jgi:hypothetical protein